MASNRIPPTLAHLILNPTSKPTPTAIRPTIFKVSTTPIIESPEIQTKKGLKKDALKRYPLEVHAGLYNFKTPSYKKCHPIRMRSKMRLLFCPEENALDFIISSVFNCTILATPTLQKNDNCHPIR
jgi:hypothetical protein